MRFAFLLLLTGLLFLRPAEIYPGIPDWPYYQSVMIACLVLSIEPVLKELAPHGLSHRPITACLIGLGAAIALSHAAHLFFWGARHSMLAYGRLLSLYLVVVAGLSTRARFQVYMLFLTFCILFVAALAVAHQRGILSLPSLAQLEQAVGQDADTGAAIVVHRIRATGMFNDPNDFALILVIGCICCCHWFLTSAGRPLRLLWVFPLAMLAFALAQTHSRGGMLAMMFGAAGYLYARAGWKRAVVATVPLLALLLVLFSGRMTEFSAVAEGTGQSRIQLWSYALGHFKANPVFGIGHGQFVEREYHVVHNSFVEGFAELGVVGGTFLTGAFLAPFLILHRLSMGNRRDADAEWRHLQSCLVAILSAYGGGLLTLSRAWVEPTYLVLGLIAAYASRSAEGSDGPSPLVFNRRFLMLALWAGVILILATYLFVRFTARWSAP